MSHEAAGSDSFEEGAFEAATPKVAPGRQAPKAEASSA